MLMKKVFAYFIVVLIISLSSHSYVYLVLFLSNALTIPKIISLSSISIPVFID
jgi:hypothetical protein